MSGIWIPCSRCGQLRYMGACGCSGPNLLDFSDLTWREVLWALGIVLGAAGAFALLWWLW